jgi:hypothetical protein
MKYRGKEYFLRIKVYMKEILSKEKKMVMVNKYLRMMINIKAIM